MPEQGQASSTLRFYTDVSFLFVLGGFQRSRAKGAIRESPLARPPAVSSIAIHLGLRSLCLTAWGFESPLGHHSISKRVA